MELEKTHFVLYQSPYIQYYCSKSLIGRRKSDAYVAFYFELDNRRRHSVHDLCKTASFSERDSFYAIFLTESENDLAAAARIEPTTFLQGRDLVKAHSHSSKILLT